MKKTLIVLISLICGITYAQTTLTGKVADQTGEPIPLANIKLRGNNVGAVTDFDGEFILETKEELPFTITVSSIGYESITLDVTSTDEEISVSLKEGTELDVVIVSASRAPERIFESPVRVEYYGAREIKNTPAIDFYSGLEDIKGVDVAATGLSFKTINTRGFGSFSNPRFVQLIDGVDNSAPALGFFIGNLAGVSELDVNNVELLPGASSALYGANAFNGLLTINTKNPFDSQGVSAYSRGGTTTQDAAGTNSFYDVGVRVAKAFSDKLAVKADVSLLKGTEWHATNYDNLNNQNDPNFATRAQDPNYNGVNTYGDEFGRFLFATGGMVSRTGYQENELIDYDAENLKFSGAIHYRPFADDLEVIYSGRLGRGTTIFQNSNRFYAPNYLLQQHKLEVKNKHFFVRGYLSSQDTGDTFDTRIGAININKRWKSDDDWYRDYETTFFGAINGLIPNVPAGDPQIAHQTARGVADTGRFIPGTQEFQEAFDEVVKDTDFSTGARFRDESELIHFDGNYNFSYLTNGFIDIQVGGSYREFRLNSNGTIFTDADSPISYDELGGYMQLQKKLLDDRLKLTGSIRYDKTEVFDGNISPRVALGFTLGEDRNHNVRISGQTGFRNPTTQNLYMGLDVAAAITIGTAPDNLDRERRTFEISDQAQAVYGQPATVLITGRDAFENAFTIDSYTDYATSLLGQFAGGPAADPNLLKKATPDFVNAEEIKTLELGYRGDYGKVSVELSGYYSAYEDFITSENVVIPFYGTISVDPATGNTIVDPLALAAIGVKPDFSGLSTDFKIYNLAVNTDRKVNAFGGVFGIDGKVFNNFDLGASYTYAKSEIEGLDEDAANAISQFNTPEHKIKVTFGNRKIYKHLGFNSSVKWNSSFFWNDAFGSAKVPSFTVIDAQINYKIQKAKTVIKVGATNIGGPEYFTGLGTGGIGSQYYVSLSINNL